MHPSRHELELYVLKKDKDYPNMAEIGRHIEICGFCREIVEDFRELLDECEEASKEPLPLKALQLFEGLHRQRHPDNIFELIPLAINDFPLQACLAADGTINGVPIEKSLLNIATHISENPEIVMRLMYDRDHKESFIQLISDDPKYSQHVLVEVPEIGFEYLTDENGRARLGEIDPAGFASANWQVKMPSAVFDLKPLVYDPEHIEESQEMILSSHAGDKITVTFQKKTEGSQVNIRVLEYAGQSDYCRVKVFITQEELILGEIISKDKIARFDLKDRHSQITIRLFQS